jgi:hypothetical protein
MKLSKNRVPALGLCALVVLSLGLLVPAAAPTTVPGTAVAWGCATDYDWDSAAYREVSPA